MGNSKKTRTRVATFIAAAGVLVMSSGAALMVSASPATAGGEDKPAICHPVNGKGETKTGWNIISPDKASSHIDESQYPNGHYWKHESKDGRHDEYAVNGSCPSPEVPPVDPTVINPQISYTDPNCDHPDQASYTLTVDDLDNIDAALTKVVTGSPVAGGSVQVTVSPKDGFVFEGGQESIAFPEHTFSNAVNCEIVVPPTVVTPAAPTSTDATCDAAPTVTLPSPAPVEEQPQVGRKAAGPVIQTADVDGVRYTVTGELVAGGHVDVDAVALEGFTIAEGATTHWGFDFAEPDCEVAGPGPQTDDGGSSPQEAVNTPQEATATPTVVEAGLTGASDLRGQQGLALLVAGMIMLVVAGGLGMVRPLGGKSRA